MKKWIIKTLAKPVLPVLIQTHKVVNILEVKLEDVIEAILKLGIPDNSPVCATLLNILTATVVVRKALEKTIEFLGGEISVEAKSSLKDFNLDSEIEKLKKLL